MNSALVATLKNTQLSLWSIVNLSRAEMLHHPCIFGGPQQREQNQNSKPTPGVTMMHHTTKRRFKDCPGFLNGTGRLGPKEGGNATSPLHSRGSPTKGDKIRTQNLRYGSP